MDQEAILNRHKYSIKMYFGTHCSRCQAASQAQPHCESQKLSVSTQHIGRFA